MMRNDDFLKNLPIDDQKYFLKKTPASETVIKIGDKISQKFPVSNNYIIYVRELKKS